MDEDCPPADPLFSGAQPPAASGTEIDAWIAGLPLWPGAAALPGLLVVAPHPDDEIAGAGGLLAAALAAGIPVRIVAVTDGTGSHPRSAISPAHLAAVRRAETREALSVLASAAEAPVPEVTRLQLPDGQVAEHAADLTAALTGLLDELPAGSWIASPVRTDGHPDHDACGRAAFAAARTRPTSPVVEYPVWLFQHAEPGTPRAADWSAACRLDVPAGLQPALQRALECFRSQLTLDYGLPVDRTGTDPAEAAVLPHAVRARLCRAQQAVFIHPAAGFDDLYRDQEDPWQVADRWYERRRAALIMAMLPAERFARAFEPGCSIGALSVRLAGRCSSLISTDVVLSAVDSARRRLRAARQAEEQQAGTVDSRQRPDAGGMAGLGTVDFRCAGVEDWPEGSFDLIVISELAYYLDDTSFTGLLADAHRSLTADGVILAAHWRHPVPGAFRSAGSAHAALSHLPGMEVIAHYEDADVLIDVIGATGTSVAGAEFALPEA